ncbi:MAG TPA: hypothetical protein VH370_01615 [Humisphaera sp.]|jgi:hypothetical protein|nr:hypothetical protein [Humisphaera sp.]
MRMFVLSLAAALVLGIGSHSVHAGHHGNRAAQCDPPASQPAKVFDGFDAALKTVPQGVLPAKSDGWTVAKRDVANAAFDEKVRGQKLKIRIKVSSVGKDGDDYVVSADPTQTSIFTTAIDVHFSKDNALDVARLSVGDEVIVVGEVNVLAFSDQAPLPELGLILVEASILSEKRR